jgi:hypothetical protein
VSELDEQWATALAEAERRARAAGRGDVVDYLALRASNDLARKTAIEWLFETFTSKAAHFNRNGGSIQISHAEHHRFRGGPTSTMVGTLLTLKVGVRSLMVEAGWPRAPKDGIVRGGGLAQAKIRHFGRKAFDMELLLVRNGAGAPQWYAVEKTGVRSPLAEATVHRHVATFMD